MQGIAALQEKGRVQRPLRGRCKAEGAYRQQTSVQCSFVRSFCSAMAATSTTTTAIPGTSRQVTGGDATESDTATEKEKATCTQEFNSVRITLPGHKGFLQVYRGIDRCPESPERLKQENHATLNQLLELTEDTFDHSNAYLIACLTAQFRKTSKDHAYRKMNSWKKILCLCV